MPQQLAHATVNGASIATGDLFASGTISGSGARGRGLAHRADRETAPIRSASATAATRAFLEDGDEVVLAWRAGEVELGEVRGTIVSRALLSVLGAEDGPAR